jgi:Tn3 transposase DDE domain
LVINVVVLWNTLYRDAALAHLQAEGVEVQPEDVARGQRRPRRNPQDPYAADGWFPALDEEFA